MNNSNIKKYNFIDWAQMIPGAIIGGFVMTPGGLGLGSDWAEEMQCQKAWKRGCISEHYTNLKDRLPLAKMSKTGVGIYVTNDKEMTELLFDSKVENGRNKVQLYISFTVNEPIGLFLGNILRSDGQTYVNILTLEGKEIWLSDQIY